MFPNERMRRQRRRKIIPLLQENWIRKEDLIYPLFVDENLEKCEPIKSMPGQFSYSVHEIAGKAEELALIGLKAVILFGIPKNKDNTGSSAYNEDGVIQKSIRLIKEKLPEMVIITDVCACEYTENGHCGITAGCHDSIDLDNDLSLPLMEKIALSHAKAGADIVAPSSMLDGVVMSIRKSLDLAGFQEVLILSYSSKFASALYGPFRDAAKSGFSFGDRTTYQMNPANAREALMESELDFKEGADILMVKPASFYLDILSSVKKIGIPVAAYQVSGEYSMIKAASMNGWINERAIVMESLISIKRAGADLILTYFAEEVLRWLDE